MLLILKYFMLACFAYVIIRIVVPYLVLFIRFMFNEAFKWDKYVVKPRLVFIVLFERTKSRVCNSIFKFIFYTDLLIERIL